MITNIGLPDGTGFELMRSINFRQTIPGITMSGFSSDDDRRSSEQAGFGAYIVKPFTFEKLNCRYTKGHALTAWIPSDHFQIDFG